MALVAHHKSGEKYTFHFILNVSYFNFIWQDGGPEQCTTLDNTVDLQGEPRKANNRNIHM
jgi:hypothetical protein